MRGFNVGSEGGVVGTVLKIAPVVCSFFAFMFLAIALSAGQSANYLESLSVVNFNMSTFGKNLLNAPNIADLAKEDCGKADNAIDKATGDAAKGVGQAVDTVTDGGKAAVDGAKDLGKNLGINFRRQSAGGKVTDALTDVGDKLGDGVSSACNKGAEFADKAVQFGQDAVNKALGSVAKAIGVKEYYSIHIGNLCEGDYKPSFNAKDAEPDVKTCTPKFKVSKTDLSKKLDEDLNVGPFKFKLSDLGLVDAIQDVLDLIPRALAAMGFFFLFAILLMALGFLGSVGIVATDYTAQSVQPYLMMPTMVALGLGWFMAGIGTLGLTAAAEKIKNTVNKEGEKFGMSASTSGGLYFLIWATTVFATVAFAAAAFTWYSSRHPSGARSDTDSDLDEQKHVARGQYPIMQGSYPPPSNVAPNRDSFYPDDQMNANAGQGQWDQGRASKEYYEQQQQQQ